MKPNVARTADDIKRDIEETRRAITAKLENLENVLFSSVNDTISAVKDRVDDVKESLNIRAQVNKRPWKMIGASVIAGMIISKLGSQHREEVANSPSQEADTGAEHDDSGFPERPSRASRLIETIKPGIKTLEVGAIGLLSALLQELIKEAVPAKMLPTLSGIWKSAKEKMGDKSPTHLH